MVQLNRGEEFDVRNGVCLSPRRMITSNPPFPESKDQEEDIVVMNRKASPSKQEPARPQRSEVPILRNYLRVMLTHTTLANPLTVLGLLQ